MCYPTMAEMLTRPRKKRMKCYVSWSELLISLIIIYLNYYLQIIVLCLSPLYESYCVLHQKSFLYIFVNPNK
jgi:hypothetical protein